jgi:cob(I)alamin adenosyltransferase
MERWIDDWPARWAGAPDAREVAALLDVARDVARRVERKMAPL